MSYPDAHPSPGWATISMRLKDLRANPVSTNSVNLFIHFWAFDFPAACDAHMLCYNLFKLESSEPLGLQADFFQCKSLTSSRPALECSSERAVQLLLHRRGNHFGEALQNSCLHKALYVVSKVKTLRLWRYILTAVPQDSMWRRQGLGPVCFR